MTESEFLKLYKKNAKFKNISEAKERVELFWKALTKVMLEEKKVTFKGWGIFSPKVVKARRVIIHKNEYISNPKKVIDFRVGKNLRDKIN